MRKALLVVVCVLFAVPLFAQEKKLQLSVFASDIGGGRSESGGSDWNADFGAALQYRFNRHWALEVQVSSEERHDAFARLNPDGTFAVDRLEGRAYPIDVFAHYNFVNDSKWKPFIGAGVRYDRSPFSRFSDRTVLEIDGGVHYMITPSLSLRLDGKQLLFNDEGRFDVAFKPSVGLGWRF